MLLGPRAPGPQERPPDALTGVIGVDRELLQMGPALDAVDAAEADRGVTGHQDDERIGELLRCAGSWERPDAERLEQ